MDEDPPTTNNNYDDDGNDDRIDEGIEGFIEEIKYTLFWINDNDYWLMFIWQLDGKL